MDSFFLGLAIGIAILLYYYVKFDFMGLFKQILLYLGSTSPFLASIIGISTKHIAAADIFGIAMFGFISKLFFLPLPSEPYTIYAYSKGMNLVALTLILALSGVIASSINYSVGRALSKYVLAKPKNQKLAGKISSSKHISILIFAAALLPIPDVASLVFGAFKVGIKKFFIYTFFGIFIKGYITVFAFGYLEPYLKLFM